MAGLGCTVHYVPTCCQQTWGPGLDTHPEALGAAAVVFSSWLWFSMLWIEEPMVIQLNTGSCCEGVSHRELKPLIGRL